MEFKYCARRRDEVVVAPHSVSKEPKSFKKEKTQERDR